MSNQLQTNLETILNEKTTKILPENIKKGITVLGVEGTAETGIDTSDATATADDLALNKTAYVNGIKLEGNVDTVVSGSMTSGRFIENSPYLAVCGVRDLLLRAGGAIQITEEQIADKGNITPEKIVKGNTIFGVEGTAETGTKINNQNKDITKNGTYTADEGYTGLGTVIVNVPQTGDVPVKLFKTKEEMNSSTGNTEGDLALVYRNEPRNMTADMEVTAIIFPEAVTLPTAFTGNAYSELRPVDSSGMFNYSCMLNKNSFSFNSWDSWSGSESTQASYTSEDGITYTRTSLQGDNPIELPTAVKGDANDWNDNFGYFMQIGVDVFEGIYIYKNNSWELAPTQLTTTSDYVYKQSFYGKNGIESGTLGTPDNSFADTNAEVYNKIQNQYENMEPRVLTNSDKNIDKNIYFIPAKKDGTLLLDTSKVTDMSYMFSKCTNLTTIPLLDTSNATKMQWMFSGCTNLTTISLLDTSNATNMSGMFNSCSNLTAIPLLDTSKATDMSYMIGNTNLTAIPELNTSKVTDMSGMFYNCTNLVTIPLLDTSNVTSMGSMFASCSNLTTIPELDTSNATKMQWMFNGCSNLTAIPELNTSNATDISGMFYNCTNLVTIPLLDTSKVTDMSGMLNSCSNLTAIPELDTSKVTNMSKMFYNCTNLVTIPLLDISGVRAIEDMFNGCTNLSDDSLNNIMQMCINATSYTGTKTLKTIGLTSEQADKCKTLSNYSAFTSAGWTTGY